MDSPNISPHTLCSADPQALVPIAIDPTPPPMAYAIWLERYFDVVTTGRTHLQFSEHPEFGIDPPTRVVECKDKARRVSRALTKAGEPSREHLKAMQQA